jgi:hypothetical protein
MTPMLRELHEARKARLQRMKAWHNNNVVPLHKVRPIDQAQQEAEPEPKSEEMPIAEPMPALTPIEEIEQPVVLENTNVSIRQIQTVVAKRYRVSLSELVSNSRNQFIMLPRQIAYALARRLTDKALPTIAKAFGGRDHTTILHGIRKVEKRVRHDSGFAVELHQLERVITGKAHLPCPCCGFSPPSGPDDQDGNRNTDCS